MTIDESIKEMDLDIPQHFTKEQNVWIKAYCIKRNIEFYNKAIDDFANGISEYLGVENAEQQRISYDTLMKYEIADAIEDVAEQLKAGVKE